MPQVDPACRSRDGAEPEQEAYLASDGYLMPCCWCASNLVLPQTREFLGDLFDQLDAKAHDPHSIMHSQAMQRIENSWEHGSFAVCVWHCPANRRKADNADHDLPVNEQSIAIQL